MTTSLKPRHDSCHSEVVSERIAEHAAQSPEAIALSFGDRQISYGELHERSSFLAHQLRARGVGTEAVVGVSMQHSPELVIALLAILKAGGCYLPIDPNTPRKRAQFQIEDSGMSLLICDQSGSNLIHSNTLTFAESDASKPLSRDDHTKDHTNDQATPLAAPDPDQAAYIIYTSGTSGLPKGCVIRHANLSGLLDAAQPFFQFDDKDRWTLFHSFAFDFSVW
jgi:non-ribosomal peptide synthetase component F